MLKTYKQLPSLTASIKKFRCNIKDILSVAKLETHNNYLTLAATGGINLHKPRQRNKTSTNSISDLPVQQLLHLRIIILSVKLGTFRCHSCHGYSRNNIR